MSFAANQKEHLDFNQTLLTIVDDYPTDGTHQYDWPKSTDDPIVHPRYDGCTRDIGYMGVKILSGNGKGSCFCCGLTLEVFLRAADMYIQKSSYANTMNTSTLTTYYIMHPIGSLTPDNFKEFKNLWYCPAVNSPGPGEALVAFGMGTVLTDWKEAKAGDFVQIWRNNGSGHSVIFMNWITNDKKEITGLKYWSSQTKKGIETNTEYFGTEKKQMTREHTFVSRVFAPESWK